MKALIAALTVAIAACSAAPVDPDYVEDDLSHLALKDGPEGTVTADDRARTLDDVSRGEQDRRDKFEAAGFIASYERSFTTVGIRQGAPEGFFLFSRAYLFSDPKAGLRTIREIVETEGSDLAEITLGIPNREGFAFSGRLDANLPPGLLFAWTKRNVVLVLAAVANDSLATSEVRGVAVSVDRLEPPEAT